MQQNRRNRNTARSRWDRRTPKAGLNGSATLQKTGPPSALLHGLDQQVIKVTCSRRQFTTSALDQAKRAGHIRLMQWNADQGWVPLSRHRQTRHHADTESGLDQADHRGYVVNLAKPARLRLALGQREVNQKPVAAALR